MSENSQYDQHYHDTTHEHDELTQVVRFCHTIQWLRGTTIYIATFYA